MSTDPGQMFSVCNRRDDVRGKAFFWSLLAQILFALGVLTLGTVKAPNLRVANRQTTISYIKPITSPILVRPHTIQLPPPRAIAPPQTALPSVPVITPPPPHLAPAVHDEAPPPPQPSRPQAAQVFESKLAPASPVRAPVKVQLGGFSGGTPVDVSKPKRQVVEVKGFGLSPESTTKGPLVAVAEAGFGVEKGSTATHGAGQVVMAGFGEASPGSGSPRPSISERPKTTPVAITEKSVPVYTDEARRLHIEGEVQVDVVFSANGTIHVLGIVKGLGHGLDEAALAAAARIRFVPSTREGKPVDLHTTLHILFQLT